MKIQNKKTYQRPEATLHFVGEQLMQYQSTGKGEYLSRELRVYDDTEEE